MFNLEQSITEWRRQMVAAGIKPATRLEELESHLREDICVLVSEGEVEARAFQMAVSRLGSPTSVQEEFNKVKSGPIWPVKIGSGLWLGAVIVAAVIFFWRLLTGRLSPLLYVHVLSVTAGYGTMFLTGGFGIYYVWTRWSGRLRPAGQQSLGQAVYLFSRLGAGLAIVGTMLGMIWSRENWGRYWGWDAKEVGALCVIVWLIALVAMQRFGRLAGRAAMLMCIGGNVIVSLAWFGANMINDHQSLHSYGMGSYRLLAVFVGTQIGFLLMGLMPAREAKES